MAAATDLVVDPFIGCSVRVLPDDLLVPAGETAVQINPANNVPARRILKVVRSIMGLAPDSEETAPLTPAHISLMRTKWWGPTGVHLTVSFTEKTAPELQQKVLHYANRWGERRPNGQRANVEFKLIDTANPQNADIRISRGSGGYYSYLGTDIQHVARNTNTMNLEGFTLSTPNAEYERVVPHEFFHTCGGPHEHMRLALVNLLDPAKTVIVFGREQGWSPQEVYQQVLTPLSEASIYSTPPDQDSLMCYFISGQCTKDGKPIRGGAVINESDFAFAAKMYPETVTPPAPPPPASLTVQIPKAGTWAFIS